MANKDHLWKIEFNKWEEAKEPLKEALCTLGNGYFATRGTHEYVKAGSCHYPGTYLAFGYNRLESEISGKIIENEDLVNWPNWLFLTFRQEDGDWFNLKETEILDYYQELNLQEGILSREIHFRDNQDRITILKTRRIVNMAFCHHAGIEWQIIPQNWEGKVIIRSEIDGSVMNTGVERYLQLNHKHLQVKKKGATGEDGIYLLCQTNQSQIRMAQACNLNIQSNEQPPAIERRVYEKEEIIGQEITVNCTLKKPLQIEKHLILYTSRDFAISEPAYEARKQLARIKSFDHEFQKHTRAWKHLWQRCDIRIKGDDQTQQLLRLHIFHLLQTVSVNSIDKDIGVPARGWHGEAYRGHIFWDELIIFPFLNLRLPEITRELLMYRHRRLPEARCAAELEGCRGAMFPWQSGSNGREESQVIHLNPNSGRWIPDNTYLQRHINSAIFYNVWQYFEANNDLEFFDFHGAEMIFDIAKYWSSKAVYHPGKKRYEIKKVVGPDEYHTNYPWNDQPGINNNAYTNIMAAWVLHHAIQVKDLLDSERQKELFDDLEISKDEFDRWKKISRKMYIPFHEGEIISQFENYDKLEELDWDKYRNTYGEHIRLDRILENEGDDVNRYKASKQADVLMLFYLFSYEELKDIFHRLEYPFYPDMIRKNIDYYEKRTSHGSTLSQIIHSWVLARYNKKSSWEKFSHALVSDFKDVQGGTTPEGIHLGAMAGTVDIIQRCYTGMEIRNDVLWLDPHLPDEIQEIDLNIRYRGNWLNIILSNKSLKISLEKGWTKKVKIGVHQKIHELNEGDKRIFWF